MEKKYADIVLPVPLPRLFTYSIPDEFAGTTAPGRRVVVSFGKRRLMSGVVFALHNNAPREYDTKAILSVLDDNEVVTQDQLALWEWIAAYYQCTVGEVYKAALPSGLKLESETRLYLNKDYEEVTDLPPRAYALINYLADNKYCTLDKAAVVTELKNVYPLVKRLIEAGINLVNEEISASYKPKTVQALVLHPKLRSEDALRDFFDSLGRAPKQLELLMTFVSQCGGVDKAIEGQRVLRRQLLAAVDGGSGAVAELIKKEGLAVEDVQVDRLGSFNGKIADVNPLSAVQVQALAEIRAGFEDGKPVLLHGVTSSGKTELYIHLIEETISKGRQALYLLPEIALTTQITNRLRSHFGDKLGVYHSRFSDGERVEVWKDMLTEERFSVILGVRSSIFLPFRDLGLIIVDEEHDPSFKQYDPAPRYNARDVALLMARRASCNILLGTATPSIESYYHARSGMYHLVELTQRHEGIQLPLIEVVNTQEAKRRKLMQSHFSPRLLELVTKALENKEQVILFQNRRGFAPYLECSVCAWVPRCIHCDVSMTYHKHTESLVCHYCGYTETVRTRCGACGSPSLRTVGFGTQKVEEEIKVLFPEARVGRMDYDTTRGSKGYEKLISSFEKGELDILVGTQMVTKGLDFDRVSLVGILNADSMLNSPDFRAFERGFQMMAQVSGRAGRKNKRGRVVLQTSDPEHPVIRFVVSNEFKGFYEYHIAEREMFRYPPYYRLISLTVKHRDRKILQEASAFLGDVLKSGLGNRVLGPQEPPVSRIRDYFLQKILIKVERTASPSKTKEFIQSCIDQTVSKEPWKYVSVVADVDPM